MIPLRHCIYQKHNDVEGHREQVGGRGATVCAGLLSSNPSRTPRHIPLVLALNKCGATRPTSLFAAGFSSPPKLATQFP
jgi:hypothetical protein